MEGRYSRAARRVVGVDYWTCCALSHSSHAEIIPFARRMIVSCNFLVAGFIQCSVQRRGCLARQIDMYALDAERRQ